MKMLGDILDTAEREGYGILDFRLDSEDPEVFGRKPGQRGMGEICATLTGRQASLIVEHLGFPQNPGLGDTHGGLVRGGRRFAFVACPHERGGRSYWEFTIFLADSEIPAFLAASDPTPDIEI